MRYVISFLKVFSPIYIYIYIHVPETGNYLSLIAYVYVLT